MIKLIGIDLDQTLLNDDRLIGSDDKITLSNISKKNVKIVFASGRPYTKTINSFYSDINVFDGYYLAFNGEAIYNIKTNELVKSNLLTKSDLEYIYPIIKAIIKDYEKISLYLYHDEKYLDYTTICYTDYENKYTHIEDRNNYTIVKVVPDLTKYYDAHKFMIAGEPSIMNEIYNKIPDEVKRKYTVVTSMPCFIEILKKGNSKYNSLLDVAKIYNITSDEIMAIGDSMNDYEMIKNSKIGIAMGNSRKEIKEISDYITKSNNECGVSVAINEYIDLF